MTKTFRIFIALFVSTLFLVIPSKASAKVREVKPGCKVNFVNPAQEIPIMK